MQQKTLSSTAGPGAALSTAGVVRELFVAGGTDYISTFLKQPTNKQRKNTRGEVNVEVSYTI